MELTANVHLEDGSYWADAPQLPGCFAAGETLDELFASLSEGIRLYLDEDDGGHREEQPLRLTSAVLSDSAA